VTRELVTVGVAFLTRQENFIEKFSVALGFLSLPTPPRDPSVDFGAFSLNIVKHTNVGKTLELRRVRVIYQVRQITHRAITTNKRDQVIVTMHPSKLKTKQEQNI
jgi:hypothetical protein